MTVIVNCNTADIQAGFAWHYGSEKLFFSAKGIKDL